MTRILRIYRVISSWLSARKTSTWFWGIFIVAFAFFSAMKHEPIFLDADPFYHAAIVQRMLETRGIIKDLPSLPMSVFSNGYTDHHFLFHVFLVPFVAMTGDPLTAIRVATSFLAALFLAVSYLFFLTLVPRAPLFPLALMLGSSSLIFRLSLDKAPAASLIVLFLGLSAILKKKYYAVFLISFLYVWLYDAWPLVLVASILFCFARACAEIFSSEQGFLLNHFPLKRWLLLCAQKEHRILFASCAGGLLAGIIINPYFPDNILFYKTHLISIAVLTTGVWFGMGSEWFPADLLSFMSENILFMAFWICALCWTFLQMRFHVQYASFPRHLKTPSSLSAPALFFMFFSLFFFFATVKSQRMSEYFIPLGSAFIACALYDFFQRAAWKEWILSARAFLAHSPAKLQMIFCYMAAVPMVALLIQWHVRSYSAIWKDVNMRNYPFHSLSHASAFISRAIPKGSLIINDDWSHFPKLMYYADGYRFAWGLDPTFTHDAYPDFFKALTRLGTEDGNISDALKSQLGTPYLLITKERDTPKKRLALRAQKDAGLKKIYEDDEAIIYQTR